MERGRAEPTTSIKLVVKAHRRDRRITGNKHGKRKVSVVVRERGSSSVPQFSIEKASPLQSFALPLRRNGRACRRSSYHRRTCVSVSSSRESTIRRHTASMARALAWLKNTSACAVPKSDFTTISPVRISSVTLRTPYCERTTAASRMAIR
jgi:hypothetical protein